MVGWQFSAAGLGNSLAVCLLQSPRMVDLACGREETTLITFFSVLVDIHLDMFNIKTITSQDNPLTKQSPLFYISHFNIKPQDVYYLVKLLLLLHLRTWKSSASSSVSTT